jgi:hypothetical protein
MHSRCQNSSKWTLAMYLNSRVLFCGKIRVFENRQDRRRNLDRSRRPFDIALLSRCCSGCSGAAASPKNCLWVSVSSCWAAAQASMYVGDGLIFNFGLLIVPRLSGEDPADDKNSERFAAKPWSADCAIWKPKRLVTTQKLRESLRPCGAPLPESFDSRTINWSGQK